MRELLARLLAALTLLLVLMTVATFGWHQQQRLRGQTSSADPAAWAALYPQHYASFMRGADSASAAADRLAERPFRARAFAGTAFALEYREARGHVHAQQDQRDSRRTRERTQPAGCINCHAAEAPALIASLGWEGLHALDYDDVKEQVHFGSSCADCHAPDTMALTLTRPALLEALRTQDIDPATLSRQDLRSLVCAQCHVEYYFRGEGRVLTLPWAEGRRFEDIERYYDEQAFSDWTHPESGAALLKVQHPDTELYASGPHAALGLACADCHMPSVLEQGLRISAHTIDSPLRQVEAACGACHRRESTVALTQRVDNIQMRTRALQDDAERAIASLIDTLVAAQAAGAAPEDLEQARLAHRRAQLRWDFIDAENSTGFHAPDEAARLLEEAAAIAAAATSTLNLQVP